MVAFHLPQSLLDLLSGLEQARTFQNPSGQSVLERVSCGRQAVLDAQFRENRADMAVDGEHALTQLRPDLSVAQAVRK